jgi:hypothetical protein
MANTLTVNTVEQGNKQFQGAFSEMWATKITVADQDAVALGDTALITCTVPGVAAGDMVIGWGCSVDMSDATDQAVIMWQVTAANTLTLTIMADAGEFAADALTNGVFKVLIGRPSW